MSLMKTMQAGVWHVDMHNDSPALLAVTFSIAAITQGSRQLGLT